MNPLPPRASRPFAQWVVWLFCAAVTYALLPGRVRVPALLLSLAGGLVYTETNYGITNVLRDLTGEGK